LLKAKKKKAYQATMMKRVKGEGDKETSLVKDPIFNRGFS
jgi:hypothetical protein